MNCNSYEKIDYLIAIAANEYLQREVTRFESRDTSDVQFDASYYRKRAKMIRQFKNRPMLQKMKLIAIRVAVALLVLILLAALAVGCIPPIREAVFKAFVEWHDDHFTVSFQPDDGNDSSLNSSSQPDEETTFPTDTNSDSSDSMNTEPPATEIPNPPTKLEVKRKPTALPQGVYEDVVISTQNGLTIDYYLNDELVLSYSQNLISAQRGYGDMDSIVTEISVNNHKGVFIEYTQNNPNYIEWSDGEYRYQIESEIYGKDELMVLAESVK